LPFRNIVYGAKHRFGTVEVQIVAGYFNIEGRPVLPPMRPDAGIVKAWTPFRQILQQVGNVCIRPNIHERHSQEFFF
jgi:hypothetical protein